VSNATSSPPKSRPNLRWVNSEYAHVVYDGRRVGAVRRRLDGTWDSILGSEVMHTTQAARRVIEAYLALSEGREDVA